MPDASPGKTSLTQEGGEHGKRTGERHDRPQDATPQPLGEAELILLPVRQAVLFPGIILPLAIGRPASIAGAQEAARSQRMLGVVLQTRPDRRGPRTKPTPPYRHDRSDPSLRHLARRRASCDLPRHADASASAEFVSGHPFLAARVEEIGTSEVITPEIEARLRLLRERAREAVQLLPECAWRDSRRDRKHRFGLWPCRFRGRRHGCDTGRKAGGARGHRRQGAARQGACALGAAPRGAPPLEADRRADAAIALLAAARAYLARATASDSKGAGRRRRKQPRSRSCVRRSKRRRCRSRRKSRRKRS